MATTDDCDPQQRREAILQRALELLPCMVFAKDGAPETRHDTDRGFRYIYFNAAMDYASGFDRTAMIGQNAKDHFPVHFQRYFEDDRAVMALPPVPPANPADPAAVLEIYEPWKVRTGDHVVHTRKVNMRDRAMLGAFIRVDAVHLGEQTERRRPVEPPKSPRPTPELAEPFFFSQAFEALPLALLVSLSSGAPRLIKNAAYRAAFGGSGEEGGRVDEFFRGLNAIAVPNEIYERSRVTLKGSSNWHVAQRPITSSSSSGSDGDAGDEIEMIVYAIWDVADPARTAEARAALKQGDA